MRSLSFVLLAALFGGSTVAACGASPSPQVAPSGAASESAAPVASTAPTGSASAAPIASTAPTPQGPLPPPEPRPAGQKNTTVQRTAYDAELRAIGLDPTILPPIAMMSRSQKIKVMTLFSETMGFIPPQSSEPPKAGKPLADFGTMPCFKCHDTQDITKVTRRMEIVNDMWNDWVMKMNVAGGGTVFCDSCHEKNVKTIDRKDDAAVRAFMKDEYVGKLVMKDGSATTCETCHGQGFQPSIFDKVWHVQAAKH